MNDVFFNDIEQIIKSNLLKANQSVKIAVAWLNFFNYKYIFDILLKKGVSVDIIINDDINNARYRDVIDVLIQSGAQIKKFKMPYGRYMHEKFCIIDNLVVFSGSYNWTDNANKNFENLNYLDDIFIVNKYKEEFNLLSQWSMQVVCKLQKLQKCHRCKENIKYIMVINQEGDYQTRADIYSVCECDLKHIIDEHYDISMYNNLNSIINKYSDMYEQSIQMGYQENFEQLNAECDFEVEQYLNNIRNTPTSVIIHAIGVSGYEITSKNGNGDNIIRIIWKEKFISDQIQQIYYL
ncbi:hypothetical protein FDB71_09835 [Clostridium botulinum]|nr:hypothetical protein [Clostridium botulinum]